MKKFFNDYMNDLIKLERWQIVGIISLVVVISGVFGWIYEFIFYFINSGFKTFYYRGANFLPWINIYATGAIMIYILTRKFKKKPLLVFFISAISTGVLEYFAGAMMYKFGNGLRCWDYNTEILNFLNIDGYVCLRSVTFFGLSALFLMYLIIPFCIYLSKKIPKKPFLIISVSLCIIFLFDEFYNLIFARVLHLPRARDVYEKIGYKYMDYYKYK